MRVNQLIAGSVISAGFAIAAWLCINVVQLKEAVAGLTVEIRLLHDQKQFAQNERHNSDSNQGRP